MAAEVDSEDDLPLAKVAKRLSVDESVVMNIVEEDNNKKTDTDKHSKDLKEVNDSTAPVYKNTNPRDTADDVKTPFDKLFEYEWPNKRSGNYFILEEHLADFLDIKISDHRLKGLEKRSTSSEECDFLIEQGVVMKLQYTEDLKAVRIEDAFQFMAETFSRKFQIYIKMVHHKEMKKLVRKQEAQRADVIAGKIPNFMKRALKETVRYNSKLNQERKEERCAYFDLQTQIIHLPQKKKKLDPNRKPQRLQYPVALIPGQFQDYFKRYTSDELKRFPMNTVTAVLSHAKKHTTQKESVEPPVNEPMETTNIEEEADNLSEVSVEKEKKMEKDPFCGICMKGPEMNKRGLPEKLIHCSQCENSGHPSCLDMNRHLVMVIQSYPWQCMECKICTECLTPHDEEEMMFCDNCDRGYHSYCVGLKEIPKGRWVCDRCGKCASCLGTNPVPEGTPGRWKNECSKPNDGSEAGFLQIHCHACSKLFRKGNFCPVCLKVYRPDEDHINPMVCCDVCDRWVHTDCDGIDDRRYMELSKDQKSSYTCILCRGEKEERMDAFHRKYR